MVRLLLGLLIFQAACVEEDAYSIGPGCESESKSIEEDAMNVMGIVTDLIAGGVGGNIAAAVLKKFDLGPIGNTVAGIVGGVGGGQLLSMLMSGGAAAAATSAASSGGMDMSSIIGNVAGGGVGGAIVMAVIGLVKAQMSKSTT
jgi:uncharacterized membrane protein YeaQ/YmgE (transglycosylase-associated protein family)